MVKRGGQRVLLCICEGSSSLNKIFEASILSSHINEVAGVLKIMTAVNLISFLLCL
jgi:hypothetical protein